MVKPAVKCTSVKAGVGVHTKLKGEDMNIALYNKLGNSATILRPERIDGFCFNIEDNELAIVMMSGSVFKVPLKYEIGDDLYASNLTTITLAMNLELKLQGKL